MISNLNCLSSWVSKGIGFVPISRSGNGKKPFEKFSGTPKMTILELSDCIIRNNAESIAVRVGEISGGGEGSKRGFICVDVDSKHKDGFSNLIYQDLRNCYPELFEKLVIDKTPSGGIHFYYLVQISQDAEFPTNCDLASRKSTEKEQEVDPSKKRVCFLELKASNNSLSQCFPSEGYTRINGDVIGEISEDDHICIISLCKGYNEVEKEESFRIKTHEKSNYEDGQTPFDQFNISPDGADVLKELGWRFYKTSGIYDKYIKPGNPKNNIGATFNRETKIYRIFTNNSALDQKCWNPSSLLCNQKYNKDWTSLYEVLVSKGYGKLKNKVENSLIKRSIKTGIELPANLSSTAKEKYDIEIKKNGEKYKFGIFWEENDKAEFKISREGLYLVSKELGFRIYKDRLCLIEDYYIKLVDDRIYFDSLKKYMGDDGISDDLKDCYEAFLQNSGKFTISRLGVLDESEILISTKSVSYKFFRNCYVCITKESREVIGYEKLNQLIWHKDIKDRDFSIVESTNGLYWDFINNAIGFTPYLMKCIGFYAHDHRDEEGYLIITTEKCKDSKDGGGSGKNIFWSLMKLCTTFKSTAASMIKKDNQFLQSWNYERVFIMSDLPKNFDLIFFKDMITDGAVVRKLYKDEFNVDVSEMAKIGASTNYSYDNSDPGLKRRVRPIEFTDYYTKRGGVKKETGKMFPKDWDDIEYTKFDNIIIECIMQYLDSDNIIEEPELSDGGFIKQFEQKYNHLHTFISEYINELELIGDVSNSQFNIMYDDFLKESHIKKGMTSFTINKALEDYCLNHKKKVKLNSVWRDGAKLIRGRTFGETKPKKEQDLPF